MTSATALAAAPSFAEIIQYTFSNNPPTANPAQSAGQSPTAVVTGHLNANTQTGAPLTYTLAHAPARGSVDIGPDGTYTYTPATDLALNGGTDTFSVRIDNGSAYRMTGVAGAIQRVLHSLAQAIGLSGRDAITVTVPVTIAATNLPPTVSGYTLNSRDPSGVVTGKVDATDPRNHPLTYSTAATTAKGSVTIDVNTGAFTYTPGAAARLAAAQAGATAADKHDEFTITVSNSDGGVATIKVPVAIRPAPTVIATIPVGDTPQGVAVSPDGTRAYVTNYQDDNSVSVIDTATNTVTTTVPVGSYPYGVAVSPDGTRAYVANYTASSASGTVSVINTATDTVTATIILTSGAYPVDVALSRDGTHAYTANFRGNSVSVIDTATRKVTATIAVGSFPEGVTVSPDGTHAYVNNINSKSVSVIDTVTNTVTATISFGYAPEGVAVSPDGTRAYVTNYEGVSVIDTATNTVTSTIPLVASGVEGVAVSRDGSCIYVTQKSSRGTVLVIDTATNTVISTIAVGSFPDEVVVSRDGTRAYVANTGSDTVSVLSI